MGLGAASLMASLFDIKPYFHLQVSSVAFDLCCSNILTFLCFIYLYSWFRTSRDTTRFVPAIVTICTGRLPHTRTKVLASALTALGLHEFKRPSTYGTHAIQCISQC